MKILYLVGLAHCGSTFLSRVLNQHSEIFVAGEITNLYEVFVEHQRGCACASGDYRSCEFWTEFREIFDQNSLDSHSVARLSHDRRLEWIQAVTGLYGRSDDQDFGHQNEAFFDLLSDHTGAKIIMDTSKSPWRLLPLLEHFGDDVKILHLIKSPENQLHSRLKRDYNFYHSAILKYFRKNGLIEAVYSGRDNYLRMKFEDFVQDPEENMRLIHRWLNLEYEPPFDKQPAPFHHLRGNSQVYGDEKPLKPEPEKLKHERQFNFLQKQVLDTLRPLYTNSPEVLNERNSTGRN